MPQTTNNNNKNIFNENSEFIDAGLDIGPPPKFYQRDRSEAKPKIGLDVLTKEMLVKCKVMRRKKKLLDEENLKKITFDMNTSLSM